jgi:drug/metabolite transporter (DMT)-like permease
LLCAPSTVLLCISLPLGWVDVSFDRLSTMQAMPFILVQGIGAGLLAGLAYPFAIARIGSPNAALFGSLTPAVTCLAALGLLGEVPSSLTLFGVAAITGGVALANRSKRRPRVVTSSCK